MKRLIAMRKQHRVFGRGSLEFVGCPNRKVLAYLRRDDRETILVVANLSRSRAAGGARPERVRRADPDRDDRADRVPAHRRSAVLPDARTRTRRTGSRCSTTPLQVTAGRAARPMPNDALAESLPALLVGVDWEGVLDTGTRVSARAPGAASLSEAAALVRLEVARDPAGALHRLGDDPHRRTPAVLAIVSVELRRRLDRHLSAAACRCCPARRPIAAEGAARPACSRASPAPARAPSSTAPRRRHLQPAARPDRARAEKRRPPSARMRGVLSSTDGWICRRNAAGRAAAAIRATASRSSTTATC